MSRQFQSAVSADSWPDPACQSLVRELQQGFEAVRLDVARLRAEPSQEQRRVQSIAIVNICADLAASVVETVGVDLPSASAGVDTLLGALFAVARDAAAHVAHLVSADAQLDRAWSLAASVSRALLHLPMEPSLAAMVICEQDVEDRWLTRRLAVRGVTLVDIALGCGAWQWLQARRGVHPMGGGWLQPPNHAKAFGDRDELAALALVVVGNDLRWLHCPGEEAVLLQLCGLTRGFSNQQKETLEKLASEWDDTVANLLEAARSL